jgi:hypothetical protein
MKSITFLFVLCLMSSGIAFAQEIPASDTSTMNGQLVKVGDQNEYQYSFKRWNVSTNPLGMIFGSYGASVAYAPIPHLAVRLDANYFNPPTDDLSGIEFGLGAPIYFRKMYKGLFLEPGVLYRRVSDGDGNDAQAVGPSVSLGYHWMWDSGLNVAVALGAGRNFIDNETDDTDFDDLDKVFATGYLRFGYAF